MLNLDSLGPDVVLGGRSFCYNCLTIAPTVYLCLNFGLVFGQIHCASVVIFLLYFNDSLRFAFDHADHTLFLWWGLWLWLLRLRLILSNFFFGLLFLFLTLLLLFNGLARIVLLSFFVFFLLDFLYLRFLIIILGLLICLNWGLSWWLRLWNIA